MSTDLERKIASIVLSAIRNKAEEDVYGAVNAKRMNGYLADSTAKKICAMMDAETSAVRQGEPR